MKPAAGRRLWTVMLVLGTILLHAWIADADTLSDAAAKMSEQSFALLATLNSENGGGGANPMLGPVATFASDTETLKQALNRGDARAQATAVNTLASDCAVIDNALKTNPKGLNLDDWRTVRGQLDQIARAVATSTAGKIASAPVAASTSPSSIPPAPPVAPAASSAADITPPLSADAPPMTPPNPTESAPVVKIESRTVSGDVVRIKGYIEGSALKSAGIYQDGQPIKTFNVGNVLGDQKIDFNFGIGSPSPGTVLRVTDANGRSAEAPIAKPGTMTSGALASNETHEGGVSVFRDSPSRDSASSGEDDQSAVKEIPSHSLSSSPPSQRHTLGGELANVQINVLGVTQTATAPPTFEVVGQIDGPGITHAGIYVDGRLIKPLPVETGGDLMNFDERFVLNGSAATIRAYGAGDQFVESSVDLANGLASVQPLSASPSLGPGTMVYADRPSAPGIGVEITSVHPAGGNLYAVAGTISGSNIASAGLYQNGVLAQPIATGSGLGGMLGGGGGLGGVLGSLIPGSSKSINFNVRVNPGVGYSSIRAYNQTGAYTEQPIMSAGTNSYGAVNPYGAAVSPGAATNPNITANNPPGGATSPYVIGRPSGGVSVPLW